MTAAGGAADFSVRLQVQSGYHWGAAGDSSDIFSGFWCSCVVVAAAAQDTAEGAVVTAAGGSRDPQ